MMLTSTSRSILVSLCVVLIWQSLLSTTSQIELSLLNHDQHLLPQKNIVTVNDFLIYPNPHAFKYFILPYLNSKTFIQTYEYFKVSHPKLEICKLLDNCETSNVLDFKETKTLYYINQNTTSPLNTILYSETSKTAIIAKLVSSEIKPNETCALLRSNEIFPFKEKLFLSLESQCGVCVARNLNNFFVTLKTNDDNFTPVARGIFYEMNFHNFKDLESILSIHYLKRPEKFIITTRYFFTIPFLKYFEYVSPLLGTVFNKLKDYTWQDFRISDLKGNPLMDLKDVCFSKVIPCRIFWIILNLIHAGLEYQIFVLPFDFLAYTLFTFTSFNKLEKEFQFLLCLVFSMYFDGMVFPLNIISNLFVKTIENDISGNFFLAKDSENFLTFDIEPKNTMWALPFFVKREPSVRAQFVWFTIFFSLLLKFWISSGVHLLLIKLWLWFFILFHREETLYENRWCPLICLVIPSVFVLWDIKTNMN